MPSATEFKVSVVKQNSASFKTNKKKQEYVFGQLG